MEGFEKIIWQTHVWEYDDLPDLYKKTSQTWQVMNPDWDYRYIPNSQMRKEIKKISQSVAELFDKQTDMLTKADIYREVMVYEYGGLWADMDSACLFPIDNVIKNNYEKEMICLPPFPKFGMDPDNNYSEEPIDISIDKLLSGIECGYWISNAVFLGKKYNIVSEEIMESLTGQWSFKENSFMGMRAELYEKHHELMSLDLMCAFHDGRFNLRNYQ